MSNTLQPSDNDRATLYSIAWDIVKRELDASDQRFTSEEVGGLVAKTAARITVDGGTQAMTPAEAAKLMAADK